MALSMKTKEHSEALLGISWAFAGLHGFLASSNQSEILSESSRIALNSRAGREETSIRSCLIEISDDEAKFTEFCAGHKLARQGFASCCVG